MKNIFVMTVAAAVLLTSCGSSRNSARNDYQYQRWLAEQGNQQPGRTMRATEPCIELAQADAENLRAFGTAISYDEKTALNEAERDARNRFATMMKVAVEGAAQDYAQNASKNTKNTAGTLGEAIMTQFVAEEIRNTKVIKTTIYDRTDGSIQVYVCLEMKTTKGDFDKKLDKALDRDGLIELEFDRDRFIKRLGQGLDDYKRQNNMQ